MAVTWFCLPLTFSRLGLRNLRMSAWACTLKVYKVFTKVGRGPWLKRKLCLGPAGVINCIPQSVLFFWVSLFPGAFGSNRVGCHVPPPGDLSNPGIKPRSPALAGTFFTTEPPGKHSGLGGTKPGSEFQLHRKHFVLWTWASGLNFSGHSFPTCEDDLSLWGPFFSLFLHLMLMWLLFWLFLLS